MWGTVFSNKKYDWEPIELQILKLELANVKCKCSTCDTSKESSLSRDHSDHNDAAIQVETHNDPLNRLIYGNSDPSTADIYEARNRSTSNTRSFRNDMHCPNCYFIWDLIRRFTKVLKDEECEIRPNMFTCDKATEKDVEIKDSATSVTHSHKTLGSLSPSLSLCEFISESSGITAPQVKSKNNNDRVTFVDDYGNDCCCRNKALKPTTSESSIPVTPLVKSKMHNKNAFVDNYGHGICSGKKAAQPAPLQGHCFCIDNFMETIRPPLPL